MKNTPLISVITVSYNAVTSIEETILSVINQTYPQIEYVIIDGGSTDGTVDIIKKYEDKIAYWVSEPDKGIYDAMNKGIKVATGEWINFMNAGDLFYNNDVVENIFTNISDFSIQILYGDLVIENKLGRYWKKPNSLENMRYEMVFGHQASFINTKYHKQNLYDTTYRSSGDYAFFFKAYYEEKCKFKYVSLKVALFDAKSGMSTDNFYQARKEDLIIHKQQNNIFLKLKIFFQYIVWKFKKSLKYNFSNKKLVEIQKKRLASKGYVELHINEK